MLFPRRMSIRKFLLPTRGKGEPPPEPLWKRPFWRSLMAVLAGNAIYFSVEQYLPLGAQHQLYQVDWGLAVDFWICLVCYGLVRLIF
jgi:hypothetical protein